MKSAWTSATLMKRLAFAILCEALALVAAQAAVTTGNLPVTAKVVQKCLINVSPPSFGTYDPVVRNASVGATGTGIVEVTCTAGSAGVTIALDQGTNASGGSRRLKNGTDYLAYEIYQPSSNSPNAACTFPGTTVWGTTGGQLFTPTGATWGASSPQDFNVCGNIPGGQNVPPGAYTDTIVTTVNF